MGKLVIPPGSFAVVEIELVNGATALGDAVWTATGDVQLNVPEMPLLLTCTVLRTGPGNGTVCGQIQVTKGGVETTAVVEFEVNTDETAPVRANVSHLAAANESGD